MVKKYFPIQTETACKSKWGWSTLYLNSGKTASCHRSSFSNLTIDNIDNFHNTDVKLQARQLMLNGQWPSGGCEYCANIEKSGGFSDRQLHNSIPGLFPDNLDSTHVDVSILEVYFSNICNLSCLYCNPGLSSSIDQENTKFGSFKSAGVELVPLESKHLKELEPKFWNWFEKNFHKIGRFHFLGGEPLYQKQFNQLVEFVDQNPNPNCELGVVTNLMISSDILKNKVNQIKKLMTKRKLKSFDVTVSIDCWGDEQEYVRYGLKLDTWLENFLFLLDQRWITLNINQTISALTIKTMPDLITKLQEWRKVRSIGHYFSVTEPGPSYLRPNIFGPGVFDKDFESVLNLMPNQTDNEKRSYQYMLGIANEIKTNTLNKYEINNLFIFLNEKDRRRGTNWRKTFPWLTEYEQYVL